MSKKHHSAGKLVQNFPGAFELLPSKRYYQLYPNAQDYPFYDGRDIDNSDETTGALNYDATKKLLDNVGKNMAAFSTAETYHNNLDSSYDTSNGVKIFLIAGSGFPTIGQIRDYIGFSGDQPMLIKQDAEAIDGDDTVPLLSATLGQQENVYYANQKHDSLPTGDALAMAYRLMQGKTDIPDELKLNIQKSPFKFDGKIIGIYSPAELHAYDYQNHHTGLTSDGIAELNIPGSSYDELGESKFIFLPDGGQYRLTTKATGEGNFDLKIKTYTDGDLTEEQLYLDVPQTTQTTTSFSLDIPSPILSVDTNMSSIQFFRQLFSVYLNDFRTSV